MRHPADWPKAGPISLALHDGPHASSATEWWYLNTHVETVDKRRLSLFAAFFRIAKGKDERGGLEYAHSVTWAISDADREIYRAESRVDKSAPEMGLARIKKGRGSQDPRLNRAVTELLEQGRVPRPDRMFDGEVFVAQGRLELDFAGNRFQKLDDGSYQLELSGDPGACRLNFRPEKPAHRHGDDGVVRGLEGEHMFYYFIPRCAVTGSVTVDGLEQPCSGTGWYDHEFGGHGSEPERLEKPAERVDIAWNWVALQLDGGVDLTAYALTRVADGKALHNWAILSDASGRQQSFNDMSFAPHGNWRSMRTFYDYPTTWSLKVPGAGIDLTIDAAFADQEFITCISKPAFWEGRVKAAGAVGGKETSGLGYIERSGFEPIKTLDQFFAAVGQEVRKSVAAILPTEPTHKDATTLVACEERQHYLDGVDLTQLGRSMLAPIREITDRGGKSWRSYAALACIDVVQGDSRKYTQWLAMPELLHVGSLIVDDVQDRSAVRRGGPACHVKHGEPLAINAGTAAYFITQKFMFSDEISPSKKLRLYDLYFETMRAGHAGQALDLDGLYGELIPAAEKGDGSVLEKRILAIHRLKAGVPAGSLARMGAVVGGGSEAQIEAVGSFFENLGLAFQIVDDVLNLRGFKGELKSRGEDIVNGTVTLPMAKAMSRVRDAKDWRWLAETLKSKPTDMRTVSAVVEKLETCGAVQACADEAKEIIEAAWQRAEPCLPDSMAKVMLRAFGWYILERHY